MLQDAVKKKIEKSQGKLTFLTKLINEKQKNLRNLSFMIHQNMALQMLRDFWRSNIAIHTSY